jgi:hypothetical protein
MAFVKLDTGILNSTLWVERECREVFITALLMAEPREFTEPMEVYEVRSLDLTGWSVPPGWYGFVDAAGVGIVRRALVDPDAGLAALEKLGSVEPESRSKDFDGRRLVRVNGGYVVLNFMKYRDRDYTAAVRAQRYRDRKKITLANGASHRDVTPSHRDITQAEAEAEAENTLEATPLVIEGKPRRPVCPTSKLIELYHKHLPMLPHVEVLSDGRKRALAARWRQVLSDPEIKTAEQAVEWFEWYFSRAATSKFLTGKAKDWHADFDFLISPNKFAKVLEGAYHKEHA